MSPRGPFIAFGVDIEKLPAREPETGVGRDAEQDGLKWEQVQRYLPLLPPMEADLLELRRAGKSEYDLAAIFGVCQADVSFRLGKARKRIRWLLKVEPVRVPEAELRELLPEAVLRDALRLGRRGTIRCVYDLQAFVLAMANTGGHYSEAARRVKIKVDVSVWGIWKALLRGLEALCRYDPRLVRALTWLRVVEAGKGILYAPAHARGKKRRLRG